MVENDPKLRELRPTKPLQTQPATFDPQSATVGATEVQQSGLKSLALKILERNRPRNSGATDPATGRNSGRNFQGQKTGGAQLENPALKRHRLSGDNTPKHNAKTARMDRLLIDACHGLEITPQEIYKALSDEDLTALASRRISLDELRTFAMVLCERRGMERGVVPQGWTEIASCAGCGPVWLWAVGEFAGCPWCHVRAKALPVPRPNEVEG